MEFLMVASLVNFLLLAYLIFGVYCLKSNQQLIVQHTIDCTKDLFRALVQASKNFEKRKLKEKKDDGSQSN